MTLTYTLLQEALRLIGKRHTSVMIVSCYTNRLQAYRLEITVIFPAVQGDYKKACGLADEKERDVKNLIDQLEEKEKQCERVNNQLKVTENAVKELRDVEK